MTKLQIWSVLGVALTVWLLTEAVPSAFNRLQVTISPPIQALSVAAGIMVLLRGVYNRYRGSQLHDRSPGGEHPLNPRQEDGST
ncbi:hypothetical protein [Salinicola halophyticus]|uniref:hypothetical protein n=1 Tax=Salinicola halophyticus TaxID=1808881 RepID=UPI003F459966